MNTKTSYFKGFGTVALVGLCMLVLGAPLAPVAQVQAADVLLVSVAITASPSTICAGQTSHITWSSTDATSIVIDQGIGSVLPYGDLYVSPTQTTTYTITGTNGTGGYGTASATVYVSGSCGIPTPTPTPSSTFRCSPSSQSVASGEYVTFSAESDYMTAVWPQPQLSWTAVGGNPSYGYGTTFGTRFYTGSISETRLVSVTDGYRTATCTVYVYNNTPTPTPTPYQYLQCSPSYTTANSGDRVYFNAWGGNGSYSWNANEGTPSYGYGSNFSARFYNYSSYAQNRTVTVTSGGQSTVCTVLVSGSYVTPTPTPDSNARIELRHLGRNVSRGQTGENTSLRARTGDTLDLIIHVRSTTGSYVYNAYVTDILPAGLTYIARSTTINGNEVSDGVTSSGINVGTISPYTETVVKLSVRVEGSYVPTWGTIVVNSTAQVRASTLGTLSAQLPITMGQNLNLATVSAVKTGPADALWLALLVSALVTLGYAVYTRSDLFGRRMAHAEISRLSRTSGPNFSK